MERIQVLINRLQEQQRHKADASQLLHTVLLLKEELSKEVIPQGKSLGSSKVFVLLPAAYPHSVTEQAKEKDVEPATLNNKTGELPMHTSDLAEEIPTLSQYRTRKDVNESVKQPESLNDKLKEQKTEVMEVIKEAPIRDLRKAIGINDQFVFINELFRGDEALYERSIKTLNNFSIFPEAEYWMNRELAAKLGWNRNQETVKHFYQLVKRRFS